MVYDLNKQLFFILCTCTVVRSQLDTSSLQTQITRLTNDVLGYRTFQDYLGTVTYNPQTQTRDQILEKLKTSLYTKIDKRVQAVTALRDVIQTHFSDFQPTSSFQTCCLCCAASDPFGKLKFAKDVQVDLERLCPTGQGISGSGTKHFPNNEVLQIMKKNLNDNPNLKWQYYGGEDGIMSIYPANKACDEKFDPRFRSWYSHTAFQTPKDVVLIIDRSGSMASAYSAKGQSLMEIAKDAANTVLDTLNPDDRVSVVFFSTDITIPTAGCYGNNLAQATPENKNILKAFVSSQSGSGGTYYGKAFQQAFQYFKGTEPKYDKRQRVKVILFLTDGQPTDSNYLNTIRDRNSEINNEVVILTFAFGSGVGANVRTILTDIANQAKHNPAAGPVKAGEFVDVRNEDNLRSSMARYYDFFSKQRLNNDITVSVPYVDAFGLGFITSVCLPVQVAGTFQGVTCIDMTISDLFADATYFSQNTDSYAFITDSRARLLVHPLLPRPSSVYEEPVLLHVRDIEKADEMSAIVDQLINGTSGSATFTSKRVMSRGDSAHDGVNTLALESNYLWKPIGIGELQLCVVLATRDKMTVLQANRPVNSFLYHRLDLKAPSSVCRYYNRVATTVSSSIKFAPFAFASPDSYVENAENAASIKLYSQYIMGTGEAGFKDGIKDAVAVSEKFDEILSQTPDAWTSAVWRYIGMREGVFRLYPGVKLVKKYDHTIRSWYRRAESQPGVVTFSKPYIDAFGSGVIITLATAVIEGATFASANANNPVAGVMGMDFSLGLFNSLIMKHVPDCESKQCFVIDNAGFIISHPDFIGVREGNFRNIENIHITQKEKAIAKLLTGNVLRKDQCINFKKFQAQSFWRVTQSQNSNSQFSLVQVPKTNVYVITKTGQPSGNCACAVDKGVAIPSCSTPGNTDSCECPCFSRDAVTYDPCDVTFTFDPEYGNAPSCIPPTPDVQLESLALEEKVKRETLNTCYNIVNECQNRTNQLDCLATAGCNWCSTYCEATSDKECSGSGPGGAGSGPNLVAIIVPVVVGVLVIVAIVVGVVMCKRKQNSSSRNHNHEVGHTNTGADMDMRPPATAPDFHTSGSLPPAYGQAMGGSQYQ